MISMLIHNVDLLGSIRIYGDSSEYHWKLLWQYHGIAVMAVAMDWARLRTDNQIDTQTGSRRDMLCNGKLLILITNL